MSKRAQLIAEEIQRDVAAGGWQVGLLIGSETDLTEKFGVSRSTLREAVRILESQQVARMRSGPNGGLVVTSPDPSVVAASVARHFGSQEVSAPEILEARVLIELRCLDLISERMDERRVHALRNQVQTFRDRPDARSALEFHLLLGELSGNRALALFAATLAQLGSHRWSENSEDDEAAELDADLSQVADVHQRITDALVDGDLALARARAKAHLAHMEHYWSC